MLMEIEKEKVVHKQNFEYFWKNRQDVAWSVVILSISENLFEY